MITSALGTLVKEYKYSEKYIEMCVGIAGRGLLRVKFTVVVVTSFVILI
jgi:hypothetical protein